MYVYDTLLIIFAAGFPRVFNYFLPRFSLAKGKEIVFKITKVLFLAGLCFSIFLYSLSGAIADLLKNPELSRGLKLFSPVPLLMLPTLGIEGIFSTYKKSVYIALYNTLTRALMLLFIVGPVMVFSGSYVTAIYGWICVSCIILIIAYIFKGIPFRGVRQEKSGLEFKEILAYSIPLLAATIAGTVYRAANQFYISRYFGAVVFAEFSNGFIEIPFVQMITGATATVLMPIFSKAVYDRSDISQITDLWRSALRKSAIIIYPMVIYFLFYAEELVTIVYSGAYAVSSTYFSVAMILNFFNIVVFAPLLLALGKVKFYARLHYGMAIAVWVIEYIVILVFNTPISVAISFVVIGIGGILISLGYSAKTLGVSFFSLFPVDKLALIALHSFCSLFLVNILIRSLLPELNIIILIMTAGIAYLVLLLVTGRWVKIDYIEILKPLLKLQ